MERCIGADIYAMKTKTLKVSAIKPYQNNPRLNQDAVAAVKASIERYGYNVPIAVDKDNVVVLGHTRLKALQQIGTIKSVKVVVLDLPEDKIRAFRVVDNKLSEKAEWDEDMLRAELRAIEGDELADFGVFFPEGELERLMKDVTTMKPVTQAEIDAKKEEQEKRFSDRSDTLQDQMVEIECAYCSEKFFIQKQ